LTPPAVSADPPVVAPAVGIDQSIGTMRHIPVAYPLICTFGSQTIDYASGSADLEFTPLLGKTSTAPVGSCGWKTTAWDPANDYPCVLFSKVGEVKTWRDVPGADPGHGTRVSFTVLPIVFTYGHTFTVLAHPTGKSTCLVADSVVSP
jgi:hypothetical protein